MSLNTYFKRKIESTLYATHLAALGHEENLRGNLDLTSRNLRGHLTTSM